MDNTTPGDFNIEMLAWIEALDRRTHLSTAVVDSAGLVGEYASLSLNPTTGEPAIAYYDSTNANLKFAERVDGKWEISVVASRGTVGEYCSLKFDAAGEPSISYIDQTHGKLVYARESHRRWRFVNVDSASLSGTSLAIDSHGDPHIAYTQLIDSGNEQILRYASFNGKSWSTRTVAAGTVDDPSFIDSPALALDSAGHPHVAYFDAEGGTLGYSVMSGSIWSNQTVEVGVDFDLGVLPSLVLDASNRPSISFSGDGMASSGTFFVTAPHGSTFSDYIVLPDGPGQQDSELTGDSAIALAPDGRPRILYESFTTEPTLQLATGNDALNATTFTNKAIAKLGPSSDSTSGSSLFASMGIDAKGIVDIAYFDESVGELKFYATG